MSELSEPPLQNLKGERSLPPNFPVEVGELKTTLVVLTNRNTFQLLPKNVHATVAKEIINVKFKIVTNAKERT